MIEFNFIGIGKTTLANNICMKWARDGFLSEDFDIVILIPMRFVQLRSLEEAMIEYVGEEGFQHLKKSVGDRCLIILEGLDEIAANRQKHDRFFIRLITKCTILEKAVIVITSRPHACKNLNVDRQIEVVGFGIDEIKEFTTKLLHDSKYTISEFLEQFYGYPHLKSLCYVPLNLVMILDIFQHNQGKLPTTLTELYKFFIVMILQRQFLKNDETCTSSSETTVTKFNCVALSRILVGVPTEAIAMVLLLCRLSFNGFFNWYSDNEEEDVFGLKKKWKDPKIVFTMEDLIQCGIDINDQFDGFGLLNATHVHQLPADTSTYNFAHLSIQEFLCSCYISLLPQQEQQHLMNKHFNDYPTVFLFLCGISALDSNGMHQLLYSKLATDDVVPAMRCMYETDDVALQSSVVPFELNLAFNILAPYDCMCVCHVLACFPVSELNMESCMIEDKGAEALVKHRHDKKTSNLILKSVDLSKNNLTAVGMLHVVKLVRKSKLRPMLYSIASYLVEKYDLGKVR